MNTNTELQNVSYEQAVMLKKVGFDWKTKRVVVFKTKAMKGYDIYEALSRNHNGVGIYWVSVPTVVSALQWCREVHGVHVAIIGIGGNFQISISDKDKRGEWKAIFHEPVNYETHDEAQSAGLSEALKIIQNTQL